MNRMKWISFSCLALAVAITATGCGKSDSADSKGTTGDKGAAPAVEAPKEPITLRVFETLGMTPEHFKLLIADPVKAKYPYITMERVQGSPKAITEALAAKDQVDLFTFFNGNWGDYKDLGIVTDLKPMLNAAKYDLNRFDQGALKTLTDLSKSGELYGLPYHMQFNALYYNKDLFDKFGVAYPGDGMTWEDAMELAKKMSRQEGETQYSGLTMDVWTRLTLQLGILPVNAATNKSNLTTDTFKKALEIAKQIYSIPGNPPKLGGDPFLKNKTTAMFASISLLDVLPTSGLNWDVAQYPSYKDKPNIFTQYDLHIMAISSTSKYKDDALKAMQVFLSDDVSRISTSQTGRVPLLVDPKFKEYFGSENPGLKGKRLSSIFKSKPNPNAAAFTKWHSKSYEIANKHVTEYLNDKIDLNTAARNADEEINKWIQDNP
ncbi:hypothetical protein GCM10020370_35220 [Paenibacillus hodogayensis]